MWRDSRCVIVTSPTYIPESAFANNNKPTHTEEVEKGSSTAFQVGLGHRFNQTVAAKITATLDGKESLDPDHLDKPPGKLTYVAPNEDGKDGIVKLESVSKQGIGRLTLTFHTGTKKLKVSIDGTMTTSGFGVSYTTTVHAKDIILSMLATSPQVSPDGLTQTRSRTAAAGRSRPRSRSTSRTAASRTCRRARSTCSPTTSSTTLTNLDLRWFVYWDPNASRRRRPRRLVRRRAARIVHRVPSGGGPVGGFMTVLGTVQFPPKGGEQRVRLTKTLGQSTNVIDATVKAEIVSEGK